MNGSGAATPFGPSTAAGYTNFFPTGGYTTSIDVYLDINNAGAYANDTRFDFSSAINQPSGSHRRDFVFNAGFYNSADVTGPGAGMDRFVVSASTNALRANAFPKNPGRDPFAITTEGWYTFQHTFYDSGGGVLAVDLRIKDAGGSTLHTWTLSDPSDIIGTTVGGNRYGWFALQEFTTLAFDNSSQTAPDTVYVDDDWVGLPVGSDPDGAGPATQIGFDAFAVIQNGINGVAVGGDVIVRPGTYAENILLNKQVDLLGAQAGVDARGRGDEFDDTISSIIVTATAPGTGRLVELQTGAAGSVIDGFTFGDAARAIESTTGPINNLQLLNNHAEGQTGSAVFLNDNGVDITVDQNVFIGSAASSTVFHLDTDDFDGLHFTNNHVLRAGNPQTGIGLFVDGNHNVGPSAGRTPLIQGNRFEGHGNGANLGTRAFDGGDIIENIFANNDSGLGFGIQNSTIGANTFSNNNRGLRFTSFGNMGADRGAQNNVVINNVFTGSVSLDVFLAGNQLAGTIGTNAFFNNSFSAATVVQYDDDGSGNAIDFSGNWWGTNTEAGVTGKIAGAGAAFIDFTPFLDSGADTSGAAGFQGDFSVLNVSAMGAQAGLSGRIQEGIDLVDAGGTVNVLAGTYSENVVVDKNVTIDGAGPATTNLEGTGIGMRIDANDVTVRDLRIRNFSQAVRFERFPGPLPPIVNTEFNNVHFVNNSSRGIEIHNATVVEDLRIIDSLFQSNGTGIRFASSAVGDGVLIDNTTFDTHLLGFYQANDGSTGHVRDVNILNSTFTNHTDTAVFAEEIRDSLIEGNNFFDNRRGITIFKNYTAAGVNVENLTISDNTFTDHANSSILYFQANSGLAGPVDISGNIINQDVGELAANWATIDVRLQSGFTHGPLSIDSNQVTLSGVFGAATAAYAVKLRGGLDDVSITNNSFDGGNVGSAGGVPPTSGVFISTDDASMGPIASTAVIDLSNNFIADFDNGVSLYDPVGAAFGNLPAGANVRVFGNAITGGALGVASGPGETVDASANWWGSNLEGNVAARTSGPVDFTPFLDSGLDVNLGADGFQGDFSTLHVTALGEQVGSTGRIQEAVDLVSNSEIIVHAGAYSAPVDVNRPDLTDLTIRGATGDPADVVINAGGGNDGFTIVAPMEVTLQDLTVTGSQNGVVASGLTLLVFDNLVLDGNIGLGADINNVATFDFTGTRGAVSDDYDVSSTQIVHTRGVAVQDTIEYSGVTELIISGHDGDDAFHAALDTSTEFTFHGGSPTLPASPGDTLELDLTAAGPVVFSPSTNDTFSAGGFEEINWTSIESFLINGSPVDPDDGFVEGTVGGDRIVVYTAFNGNTLVRIGNTVFDIGAIGGVIRVFGGDGDDVITTAGNVNAPVEYHGGDGNDYLAGANGNDRLFGDDGNDRLLAGEGDNYLEGGEGDDYLNARSGNDTMFGGDGNDRLFPGDGDNTADGGDGNDQIAAGSGIDILRGGAGNDTINGGAGNDILLGGGGDDRIFGHLGHDVLIGGTGREFLRGDAGDDLLIGGTTANAHDATSDAALLALLNDWVTSRNTANFGALSTDGFIDDISGSSGADAFHSSLEDLIRDFRVGDGDQLL